MPFIDLPPPLVYLEYYDGNTNIILCHSKNNDSLQLQQAVPGPATFRIGVSVPSTNTDSATVSKLQDSLPSQQPSTIKDPTTTSIPQAIQALPSAIPSGVRNCVILNTFEVTR